MENAWNSTLSRPKKPMRRSAFKPPSLPLRKEGKGNGKPTSAPKRKVQVFKQKIWSTKYTDQLFSNYVRQRDGKCMRCYKVDIPLDNSHYWERGRKGTRFDPLNCVALCRDCHTIWEKHQNHEYMQFMAKLLGPVEYINMEKRARTIKKMRDAVLECMEFLKGDNRLASIN